MSCVTAIEPSWLVEVAPNFFSFKKIESDNPLKVKIQNEEKKESEEVKNDEKEKVDDEDEETEKFDENAKDDEMDNKLNNNIIELDENEEEKKMLNDKNVKKEPSKLKIFNKKRKFRII